MIMFLPVQKVDLTGMPDWFVWAYLVVYCIVFAAMIGGVAYLLWLLAHL